MHLKQVFRKVVLSAPSLVVLSILVSGCGAIPFADRPAFGYEYGSKEPLRVAIVDTTGSEWSAALAEALQGYSEAAQPYLEFQTSRLGANIVITVKSYTDQNPPELSGYDFPFGAGGFATTYDAQGTACNYPPSPLPLNCTGEITTAEIYLNGKIPAGQDIEARRLRLVLHELGHTLGLTRHSPALGIDELSQRYGWY